MTASRIHHPGIQQAVQRIVYSSEDLVFIRTVLQQVIEPEEQIPVSTEMSVSEMLTFVTIDRYNKGLLLTYEQAIPLQALYNGLIVFTGHTKYTGKTLTVLYNEGTSVTYGFVDELALLPYTPVNAGDELARKNKGQLYIQVEQNGAILKMDEILLWLKEQSA